VQYTTTTPGLDGDMWEMTDSDTFGDQRLVWEAKANSKELRIYILIKIVQ